MIVPGAERPNASEIESLLVASYQARDGEVRNENPPPADASME